MKTSRVILGLIYTVNIIIDGEGEDTELPVIKVKAEQERIFPSRQDKALQEGFVISGRFRIRENLIKDNLKYVEYKNKKYKVYNYYDDNESHYSIIEIGEMI